MSKLKPWGDQYEPYMCHAPDLDCPCKSKSRLTPEDHIPLLLGFSTEGPGISGRKVGIGIFECDSCHQKFWYHLSQVVAEYFKMFAPQWPKD